jgi:hypothetical protein
VLVINQKTGRVNVIWGLLTVAFAAALVRGHFGAETTAGRVAVDVIFGVLFVVSVAMWVSFLRHPARFEITAEVISFSHRGQSRATRLHRTGDLYIGSSLAPGGKQRFYFLRAEGSDEALPLQLFDHSEVAKACVAAGWQFVQAPPR